MYSAYNNFTSSNTHVLQFFHFYHFYSLTNSLVYEVNWTEGMIRNLQLVYIYTHTLLLK